MDPCVWILPVPTKLKAAVAESSVLPVPEIRMDRWKRERNVQGVLGVHVDGLVGGGNLAFQKAVQWLRTELEFGTWEQSRFRGRELCQEYSRKSIKISMSKFAQEMEPVAVPKTCERRGRATGKQTYTLNFVEVSVSFNGCRCKEIHSCRLPLESCKAGLRLLTHDLPRPQQVDARSQIDAGSLRVDCVSAVIVCLAHGRRRSLGRSP